MNYNKQTVKDVPLSGKKVLLRCDFNVPQDKTMISASARHCPPFNICWTTTPP